MEHMGLIGDKDEIQFVAPKPTPTPSITVGTQVRLTGVVMDHNNTVAAVAIGGMAGSDNIIWVMHDQLEVIRQPFKRGEVVVEVCSNEEFVVIEDEAADELIVGNRRLGMFDTEPSRFERRP